MIARLACALCFRDDWDLQIPAADDGGTIWLNPTAKEMRLAAMKAGWRDIQRCGCSDSPFDWQTHSGICDECVDDWFGPPNTAPLFAYTEPAGAE